MGRFDDLPTLAGTVGVAGSDAQVAKHVLGCRDVRWTSVRHPARPPRWVDGHAISISRTQPSASLTRCAVQPFERSRNRATLQVACTSLRLVYTRSSHVSVFARGLCSAWPCQVVGALTPKPVAAAVRARRRRQARPTSLARARLAELGCSLGIAADRDLQPQARMARWPARARPAEHSTALVTAERAATQAAVE